MDTNTSFWQNVLILLIGMLQSMVNLVIWEKHKDSATKPDESEKTSG